MTGFEAHHTILVVLQFLTIGLVFLLIFGAHQRKLSRRHEFSKAFLDKMSSEQFIEILETSSGRRSVERILGTYKPADEWITDAIRRSVVICCIGIACLAVYVLEDFSGHQIFLGVGSVLVGGAVGYLMAAALTRGRARRESDQVDQ